MGTTTTSTRMPDYAVAVLGAGPAGLAAARWLKQHGFEPVVFEAADRAGGQWNRTSPLSGTWTGMRTNTSRVLSAFSDLEHAPGTAVFPRQDQMLDYLERYAAKLVVAPHVRLRTRVERLERADEDRWLVRTLCGGGTAALLFRRVVVATGRHVAPDLPSVPGLETFTGDLGVVHTHRYRGAEPFRGKHAVVAGCSISALEVAAELAYRGAASVTATYRRQRYVVPKLIAGVPADHVLFTRAAALAAERADPAALAEGLRATILAAGGNPAQYGAPAPDTNVLAAGITMSQHFLPAVAEGRIVPRPWIAAVDGRRVEFADGTHCDADALLLGTGYRLSLPWLEPAIAATLELEPHHLSLHAHTFHPDLPGLAFLGLYDQVGPLLPVLELQARWIAYVFAGAVRAPTAAEMEEGVEECRAHRSESRNVAMHRMARLFARNAGVEPDLDRWRGLERALLFGPLAPISYRLQGPDCLPDAAERAAAAASAFDAITSPDFTAEQRQFWEGIGAREAAAA
jgi:dimethylaniline monooxygenase (N-oxide forming)